MTRKPDASQAAPPEDTTESLGGSLWSALQSVRTTIYILPILAIATTIGAIIPQGRPPDYYQMVYGAKGRLVTTLGFDNLYSSTWFIVLIAALLLNLAACVARSWGRARRRYHGPNPEALAAKLNGPGAASCWQTETTDTAGLRHALAHARYAVTETAAGDRTRLLVRRWPLAHYGSILTHMSIFLVAVGAVLGCLPWTSLDDHVTLAEGETHADGARTLGFDVRLDDFRMEYYEQEGTPSSYESDVVLLADGREVGRGTATVNHQVTYHGTSLGQSSWGLSAVRLTVPGEPEALTTPLEQVPDEHGDGTAWVPAGQGNIHMLADGKAAIVVTNFAPESVEEDGELLGMTGEYPRSPAVAVQLITSIDDGKHETHDLGWIGLGKARTMAGHTVRFDDLVYVSTLSARRDPGLPLVWAGFILVSLGMIITFYVRPRAFLVELRPAGPVTEVRTAPAGRELLEADRHLIEAACGSPLRALQAAPRSATPTRRG